MKRIILSTIILAAAAIAAQAAVTFQPAKDVVPSSLLVHQRDHMNVNMIINLGKENVKSSQALLLTPVLTDGLHSVDLPSVGIYGFRRYIHYKRNDAKNMISGPNEFVFKAGDVPEQFSYFADVPYQSWMDGAKLMLERKVYGCCKSVVATDSDVVGSFEDKVIFRPNYVYATPRLEKTKNRALTGSAMVQFVVDRTDVRPDFANNRTELGKIQATIDSVRNDGDITITRIWLKGSASPEDTYKHNTDLAKRRTQAVKNYVKGLYNFDESIYTTDFEPEDWAGLRDMVVNHGIANKDEILALIDSNLDPDVKEAQIKTKYPKQYQYMLREWYPLLRRTDYRVEYTVRNFTDTDEIKRIIKTEPSKLSVNELFLAASTYQPGSKEYNEIFDIAARMYPNDEVAQINGANAAMQRGDLNTAALYLEKAGNSGWANYARGNLAALNSNKNLALDYFIKAKDAGIAEADAAIEAIRKAF